MKHFYSHLIDLDPLIADLDLLDITPGEKKELEELAHVHMHQAIMDSILSELSEADKKKFLELAVHGEDEKIWKHLNSKVEKIEDKITLASEQVKKELREDIKKVRARKD